MPAGIGRKLLDHDKRRSLARVDWLGKPALAFCTTFPVGERKEFVYQSVASKLFGVQYPRVVTLLLGPVLALYAKAASEKHVEVKYKGWICLYTESFRK